LLFSAAKLFLAKLAINAMDWLDAIALKVRENHRVISLSLVIVIGVDEQGEQHLLGFKLGAGESEAF